MKNVRRFDRIKLDRDSLITPQGFLRAPAYVTRVGIFTYLLPDGKRVREFRPLEEVMKADSISTLTNIPVTNKHPVEEVVTPENSKNLMIGMTGETVKKVDSEFLETYLTITDKTAIEDIRNGRSEVSAGYMCEHDETPGVYQGQEYDVVQRNIRYNHVALVDRGRAGPEVRLRLDSDDGVEVNEEEKSKEKPKMKISLNGQDFEVEENLGKAINDAMDKMKADMGGMKSACDQATSAKEAAMAKADAAEAELKKAKETKNDAADIHGLVQERLKIERVASELKIEKVETLSDLDLKKAVIKADTADAALDGKSNEYINARFDIVAEKRKNSTESANKIGEGLNNPAAEVKNDSEDARKKAMDRDSNAWKSPLMVSKQ